MTLYAALHIIFDLASVCLWIVFAASQLMWRRKRFG